MVTNYIKILKNLGINKNINTVVFRVDSSKTIGSGHLIRCINFANELRSNGKIPLFISRDLDGNINNLVNKNGFNLISLSKPNKRQMIKNKQNFIYEKNLEVDWETDSNQTAKILKNIKPELLIIDHYSIDIKWERKIKKYVKKLFVIDDLANRKHNCDYILDYNLVNNYDKRYDRLVSSKTIKLLGPEYIILNKDYRRVFQLKKINTDYKIIIIYFGLTDKKNLSLKVLNEIIDNNFKNITINIILTKKIENINLIINKAKNNNINVNFLDSLPNLASLIYKCDLFIGASGTTSWERLCLNKPSLIYTMANNQKKIAEELNRLKYAKLIGTINNFNKKKLIKELKNYINAENKNSYFNENNIVDPYGSQRIIDYLNSIDHKYFISEASKVDYDYFNQICKSKKNNYYEKMYKKYIESSLNNPFSYFTLICRSYNKNILGLINFYLDKNKIITINYFFDKIDLTLNNDLNILYDAIKYYKNNSNNNFIINSVINLNDQQKKLISNKNKTQVVICTDQNSWINKYVPLAFNNLNNIANKISWTHDTNKIKNGEICFYLSYEKILKENDLSKFKHNIIIHESNLPKGKGWSPMTWQVIAGLKKIPITLFEASEKIDNGDIYVKSLIQLSGNELVEDIRKKQFNKNLELMVEFLNLYRKKKLQPKKQKGISTYYKRRYPEDSKLDINKSIKNQINLLKTIDDQKYPAFFYYKGKKFYLKIYK